MSITNKQRQVFNFYKEYIGRNGFAPTYAAAAKALGVEESVIFSHVVGLCKGGYLQKNDKGAVSILGDDYESQLISEIKELKEENKRLNSVIDVLLGKIK